jgi:hypothetical protein
MDGTSMIWWYVTYLIITFFAAGFFLGVAVASRKAREELNKVYFTSRASAHNMTYNQWVKNGRP